MGEKLKSVHVLLPADLVSEIDRHAEELRRGAQPMATRSDAIRAILAQALRPKETPS